MTSQSRVLRPGSSSADRPRRAAYDVLHLVGASEAYSNLALATTIAEYDLVQRDAGFVTEIVNGTLRRRGTLDAVLRECVDRPLAKLDPRVLDVLRLGAYQLLFSDVDAYAAVDTSVELIGEVAGAAPRGLVNAVLRRVSNRSFAEWGRALDVDGDAAAMSDDQLSIAYSHPRWIISAYRDALGKDGANGLPALLRIDNEPPEVTLVARPGRSTVAELVDSGASPGNLSPYAAKAPPGRVNQVDAVRDGRAGVQDEGSQLVAVALANAPVAGRDEVWIDLCAGPGGKAALLEALAAQRNAYVVAIDSHLHRAQLVAHALPGMGAQPKGSAAAVVGDGRMPPIRPGVDRVLLDAPCTGLGVVRRRSELRWRRQPSDVAALAVLQKELLQAAIDLVRPGGVVGYATCSPHIAETDLIVADAIRRNPAVRLADARALFPGVPQLGAGPTVRLWPHRHATDGMYFALMRRQAGTP